MKDIKVIFRGNKVPSGMTLNVEQYVGAKKLENLEKDGSFEIEVIDKPKAKPKKKKSTKKESVDE
jgi:hypothetical protein